MIMTRLFRNAHHIDVTFTVAMTLKRCKTKEESEGLDIGN